MSIDLLAYELYLRNKDSGVNVVKREKPIKKIYVLNDNVVIDTKTLDEYGSSISEKYRILQESLAMPLNTSNSSLLNLPDFRTSTNQPNPYVEIRCNLKRSKSHYNVILLLQTTVNDKDNLLQATFDASNNSISIQGDKDIRLRIDTQNYEIVPDGKKLFDEYVNAGILTKDCLFSSKLFTRIVNEFFSFIKSRNLEIHNLALDFSIYVLPSDSAIRFVDRETDNTSVETKRFTDAFGNLVTAYASTSTKDCKVSFVLRKSIHNKL